jgi:aromatic ring-opening dioxygenase catalytic subunit (LigB family)
MGEIVAAALVSHVPPLVFPKEWRLMQGFGEDTDLIPGLARVRAVLDEAQPDTLVIIDSHWLTTVEHVLAGARRHKGVLTSEELPTLIAGLEYDYPGAPELGAMCETIAAERSQERGLSGRPRVVSVDDDNLPHHYSTINVVKHLRREEKILGTSVCQTARPHNFMEFGNIIHTAVSRTQGRVAIIGSGAMSHRFHPFDTIATPHSLKYHEEGIYTAEARDFDKAVLGHWAAGDHAQVLDCYQDYMKHFPESWFGHYLVMLGALGGRDFSGKGTAMSRYENMLGTGNIHVCFDVSGAAT